jgi:hypothetical protein
LPGIVGRYFLEGPSDSYGYLGYESPD